MTKTAVYVCALAALLVLASCSGAPTEPEDFEFGRVDVYVRDVSGQTINGVPVRLERLNGQIEDSGGLTGSVGLAGYYFFLKTAGDYRVVMTLPAGYAYANGQSGTASVTFSRNQTKTITFVLQQV